MRDVAKSSTWRCEEPGGAGTLPASGSGVGGPAQTLELAPETLAGPALPADAHHRRLGPTGWSRRKESSRHYTAEGAAGQYWLGEPGLGLTSLGPGPTMTVDGPAL
jgi:hypothetical protein